MNSLKQHLSNFSVLRSPFSVLRSPFDNRFNYPVSLYVQYWGLQRPGYS